MHMVGTAGLNATVGGVWGVTRLVILVGAAVLASGCTTWVKPGAGEHERQATIARCEACSQMQAPAEMVREMVSPARDTPRERRCNRDSQGRESCITSGGDHRAAVYRHRDLNEAARRAVFRDCMFSFGWRPEQGCVSSVDKS